MKKLLYSLFIGLIPMLTYSQNYTISGYVKDFESGEKLFGANIYEAKNYIGTTSNAYGFFSLTLPTDTYDIVISFVGFKPITERIILHKDVVYNAALKSSVQLDVFEVSAEKSEKIQDKTQMSMMSVPMKQIEQLPTLLGERDIIKTIQLLPGIQSGSEGSSGLYVRGGGPDQNLILLDGVPVYNANHLFGFFSVFNSDAIQSVDIIKGGFPAHYGGRLSSVLDIRMKEGNLNAFHGKASIGLIASRLMIEGPIIKDKTSFIISGRRTYADIIAKPFIAMRNNSNANQYQYGEDKTTGGYFFHDLNAKINHKFSDKNRLFLSTYLGKDKAYTKNKSSFDDGTSYSNGEEEAKLIWGNITSTLRWNSLINKKLFANTTALYSRYQFSIGMEGKNHNYFPPENETKEEYGFEYFSGIEDFGFKIDFDYLPNPNHYIKFGAAETHHTFTPGVSTLYYSSQNSTENTTQGSDRINAHEMGVYIEDDIKLSRRLKTNIGFHASAFFVNDTAYIAPQPRFALNYKIMPSLSFKLGYSRMVQYIHLLTNGTVGLPTDLWVPVTDKITPMTSDQIAAGLAYNWNDKAEITLEGYYKTMNNIIEYKDGASFSGNATDWQEKVEIGKGWSYGGELFIQKKWGKTTGWIGYTLSWTKRQFDKLNFGHVFPYKFDRRHDISIALVHQFNNRFSCSATWVYGTGNAITLPIASYAGQNQALSVDAYNGYFSNYLPNIDYIKERNGYRTPAYHRLDLGMSLKREKKRVETVWNLGLYNAYSRQNPFYLYFKEDYSNSVPEKGLYQISLFPIIPALSYEIIF